MIEIIQLMLNVDGTHCYFCREPFRAKDFPLHGKDKVEIHHVTYVPEYKVLAHKKCHRKYHKQERAKRTEFIL
jgi:hypothetical protein